MDVVVLDLPGWWFLIYLFFDLIYRVAVLDLPCVHVVVLDQPFLLLGASDMVVLALPMWWFLICLEWFLICFGWFLIYQVFSHTPSCVVSRCDWWLSLSHSTLNTTQSLPLSLVSILLIPPIIDFFLEFLGCFC